MAVPISMHTGYRSCSLETGSNRVDVVGQTEKMVFTLLLSISQSGEALPFQACCGVNRSGQNNWYTSGLYPGWLLAAWKAIDDRTIGLKVSWVDELLPPQH